MNQNEECLNELREKRDSCIRGLWCIFNEMSSLLDADDISMEDYDVWGVCTKHSSVQEKINPSIRD